WFEREAALLDERRKFDASTYERISKDILKGIRGDYWKGKFDKLEVSIPYSNPVVSLMQKAIMRYGITRNDVQARTLGGNSYTVLKGRRNLSIFYGPSGSYNTDPIARLELLESSSNITLEGSFSQELSDFKRE